MLHEVKRTELHTTYNRLYHSNSHAHGASAALVVTHSARAVLRWLRSS
jgi:hypothetical protein|eukprot:COSAG06_NODE_410_length_16089_cov_9.968793_16_plen_48_part_00